MMLMILMMLMRTNKQANKQTEVAASSVHTLFWDTVVIKGLMRVICPANITVQALLSLS